jgi:hypothetical protein
MSGQRTLAWGSSNIYFVNPAFLHTLHSALSLDNFVKRPIFQIGFFAIVIYYVLKENILNFKREKTRPFCFIFLKRLKTKTNFPTRKNPDPDSGFVKITIRAGSGQTRSPEKPGLSKKFRVSGSGPENPDI